MSGSDSTVNGDAGTKPAAATGRGGRAAIDTGTTRAWEGGGAAPATIEAIVRHALEEDVGDGDWTTLLTVPDDREVDAVIVAKEPLVAAGLEVAAIVFDSLDPSIRFRPEVDEGDRVEAESVVAQLSGPARGILTGERTALNFLGRLSGIATVTRAFVEAIAGTRARILDTRKTTPGLRILEKAAVRAGGGFNHRMGLYDMILVKDNHIDAAGGIGEAIRRVDAEKRSGLKVEVEVRTLGELEEALAGGVDRILLDNMGPETLRAAVERVHRDGGPRPELEASGNVTLATVRAVAETGVDFISVGAITHSAPNADLSLRVAR